MIEQPQLPAIRVVALVALCAKCLFVLVICLMAAVAIRFAVFEFVAAVTFLAEGNCMLTDKWKVGHIVIKANLACPAGFIMALLADFSLLPTVYIINLMAAQAIRFQLVFMYITLMTGVAAQFLVFAAQLKFCIAVM